MTLAPLLVLAASLAAPYSPGERMGFSIDLAGMRVATASISVGPAGARGVPVTLEAHTTGLIRALHDFRESLVSWLDPGTGLPTYFEVNIRENKWKHYDTTEYDRGVGVATVIQRGRSTSTDKVTIRRETLDFLALVFQLRSMPLEPGVRRTFSVMTGTEGAHEVVAEVMERETVETKAGTFPSLKIRVPTGLTGKFSEKNPTYLWLSDDARRIVVRITTDFAFGSGAANLMSYTEGESPPSSAAAAGGAGAAEGASAPE